MQCSCMPHIIKPENQFFMLPKNINNNAKHVLSLQPFYAITLMFSSKDQSYLRIAGK